jgi:hypothetical protein
MSRLTEKFKALPKWTQILLMALLAIGGVTVFGFIFGYIIMWLWNKLMPEIFGITTITYWQGIGLFILARILLGSFGSDNSNKVNSNKTKKSAKVAIDPDWNRYNTWWEKEGKNAFENYSGKEES